MFMAARSDQGDSLQLFQLALEIVSSGNDTLPQALREYANNIIKQAQHVIDNPKAPTSGDFPEAIALAFRMALDHCVKQQLHDTPDVQAMTPESASKLLMELS